MREPSAAHLKAIVDGAVDGIIITDDQGTITFANQAAGSIFNYDSEDLAGIEIRELIPDDVGIDTEAARRIRLPNNLILAFAGLSLDTRARQRTGRDFPVALTVTRIDTEEEPGKTTTSYTVIARDLSKKVSAQMERQQLEALVAQGHKLESVGRLAAGVAHEINTPTQYIGDNLGFLQESFADVLAIIQAFSKAATTDSETPSAATDAIRSARTLAEERSLSYLTEEIPVAIEHALEGTNQIAGIVSAMKAFCHPGQEDRVPLNLNTAIQNTVDICRNEWKSVAKIDLDLGNLPPVPCHENEIKQVFLNIIVNAAHAIGADTNRARGSLGTIRIATAQDGHHVEVTITDDGPGMPASIQQKIFDPFFTTKEVGKGTGQGLALARATVVEQHGGDIMVDSAPGSGTTFRVCLPVSSSSL